MRRNLIFMLMSIEIMLNGAAMAASEVAIGLALVLRLYRHHPTLDADAISDMRG